MWYFYDGGRSLANKETASAHLIGQPLGGWSKQNRMLGGRGSELIRLSSALWGRHDEAPTQDGHRLESSQ